MSNPLKEFFALRELYPPGWDNRKPLWVLLISALCLIGINYLTPASSYLYFKPLLNLFGKGNSLSLSNWLYNHPNYSLHQLMYWGCWNVFFYFILPACVIKLVWKEKLADYGFKLKGALMGWPIYMVMLAVMIPCVYYMSYDKGFQQTYPFYEPPRIYFWGKLFIWELFYVLQFITLEFFFRGFMIHGTKQKFGIYSVFIMMVPYSMIHFGKPLPECIGSIIAGIVLGTLSYKYTSVVLGACMHITVAISMDLLSLWHKGYF